MPLTLNPPPPPAVTIVAPVYQLAAHHDPNWRNVEAVASRFALRSHRTAVRIYLYSTLGDVAALRRWGDHLLYPKKLKAAIRRGRRVLAEADRQDPGFFGRAFPELLARMREFDALRAQAAEDAPKPWYRPGRYGRPRGSC